MRRYTTAELNGLSDLKFAALVLNERANGLKNPYTPLSIKLRSAIHTLEELASEEDERQQRSAELFESFEDVFTSLNWTCHRCDDGMLELEKYSPAGEDFVFYIDGKDIWREVAEYARSFDVSEHVELWIGGRGERGVPESARELVEDAEAIQKMLNELSEALESVENADNCEVGTHLIKGRCSRDGRGEDNG